ncbi:MAG TPA: M23 family metallopeptidase [Allosphingosinicella sp.]|nr:M23 family metallopeptidase [Allosphingosinicella sp.]
MQRLVLGLLILITGGVIAFLVAMIFASAAPPDRPAPSVQAAAGLLIPVEGVRADQLRDTFAEARGAGRPHDAIDIMAPRGTAVIAVAEGTVEKLFFSRGGGGITAYVRSPDRRLIYYYAHLDSYAPGLREGRAVRRGDPIGTVGSTGNASPAGPHLHFAVHEMRPGERWWEGRAVNPYPLLAGGGPRR